MRDDFLAHLGFTPDDFQVEALDALDAGRSVLVAAPTGAGKTVVGEYACHRAVETPGDRCFYTTPIKALSNQKFRDLQQRYGEARVGLLTGDRSINGDAPVVVMTTEVLRNMIYAGSHDLDDLAAVVLDEVHYLADRSRGAVWEEVIVQLPSRTQLVSLSATVSNAEEFGDWLDEVRDGCAVIVSEHRPVPLRHHYFVNGRVHRTFTTSKHGGRASQERREAAAQARGGVPNPDVLMLERNAGRSGRGRGRGRRLRWPDRPTTIAELRDRDWLPAIVFVFSRRGCDKAVDEMMRAGARLTSRAEADEIERITDTILADIPDEDLRVLGRDRLVAAMRAGVAAHHAGMIPAFKEAVEACFQRGLLSVVFATETLALGINMPARTVVIERLEKWNGEAHVLLSAGQYTQLTGRAGRRGIDDLGNAVVLYQRDIDFRTVAGLVGRRTYPLESSFAPSYNMAVNLLRLHTLDEARDLLEQSFAQFQADRSVSTLHEALEEIEAGLDGYEQHLHCEHGDWSAYWGLRHELTRLEKQEARERRRRDRDTVEEGLMGLQPGDVVHLDGIGQRGLAAVVGLRETRRGAPVAELVSDNRALRKIGSRELDVAPRVVDRIRLPNRGSPRSSDYRAAIGVLLRAVDVPPPLDDHDGTPRVAGGPSDKVQALRQQLRGHPCHACEARDDHERWQRRADKVTDEARGLRQRIGVRTGNLVRNLDQVLEVLGELGYVDARPRPTPDGLLLAGIYSEVDLLVAEALRAGLFDDLSPPELASLAAVLVYESRSDDPPEQVHLRTRALDAAVDDLEGIAEDLRRRERSAGLPELRELDPGFANAAYRWAGGQSLDQSLGDMELTGGDFVRIVRMLADLVGQLRNVGGLDIAGVADHAIDMLRRGVVDA